MVAKWLVHWPLLLEATGLIPARCEKISGYEHYPLASLAGVNTVYRPSVQGETSQHARNVETTSHQRR